jgi:hypothetical protein
MPRMLITAALFLAIVYGVVAFLVWPRSSELDDEVMLAIGSQTVEAAILKSQ